MQTDVADIKANSSKGRNIFYLVLRLLIAAGLVFALFLVFGVNFDVFDQQLDWGLVALGLGIGSITITLSIFRWIVLLSGQGTSLPFIPALRLTFIGFFFNLVIPGGAGGDVVKAYYVSTLFKNRKTEVVTTVFFDRFLGLFALITVAMVACIAFSGELRHQGLSWLIVLVSIAFCLPVIGASLFFNKRFRSSKTAGYLSRIIPFKDIIVRVYNALDVYRNRPGILGAALGLSVAGHAVGIAAAYCFTMALHIQVPLPVFLLFYPLVMAANMLPLTPLNIGVTETMFVVLFGLALPYSIARECFWIGVLCHGSAIFWSLIGSVFYIQGKDIIEKAIYKETKV